MTCPKCRARSPEGTRRCAQCGTPLAPRLRAARPPGGRKRIILALAIAGAVLLALLIAIAVTVSAGKTEGERLARKAEETVKLERKLAPSPLPAKATPVEARPPATPAIHRDERRGFSIPIPEGWKVRPSTDPDLALEMSNGDAAGSYFALVLKPGPPGLIEGTFSFQEHIDALVAELRSVVQDLRVIRREPDRCSGHPAFLLTFAGRTQGTAASTLQYLVASPSASYVLTWSTRTDRFGQLEPTFEKTSRAFTIPPPAPFRPESRRPPSTLPASPTAPETPKESPKEEIALVRHGTRGFSLPVPPGWTTQESNETSSFRPIVALSMTHRETGGHGAVSVEPAPAGLATGKKDFQAWLKEARGPAFGTVLRQEMGTCSGFPALLAVFGTGSPARPSQLSYFVATPECLYEIKWRSMSQHFDRLEATFEKCSKAFSAPPKK